MHYSMHALLNCVALLSLLCNGNAGKVPPPSEVLSHFARTVGSVLSPALSAELQRPNQSVLQEKSKVPIRRQVDNRQDVGGVNSAGAERNPGPVNGAGNLPFPGQGFPYQYERSYSFRYPPFNQQLSQNFFPGGGNAFNNQLLPNGLPFDPRFFQAQLNRNPQLAANPPTGVSKGVNAKLTEASDGNSKETGNNNVNTLQNLETNVDSKSSAQQNRPYDNSDFSSIPINPGQGGANLGLDANGGNLRVDNRYSAIDYERVRQNYYSDPPVNQRYYSSFNEIPFNAGPPYRSSLNDRYSNLDYNGNNGGGRNGGGASDFRAGNGLGNPYFGNFFQGPYQSLNFNNLQGGGNGGGVGVGSANNDGAGAPFAPENFDRGSQNFRSQFGLQYPGGFGGPGAGVNFDGPNGGANFGGPGGDGNFGGPGDGGNTGIGGGASAESTFFRGGSFGGEGDSSLRASSAKQTLARPATTASSEVKKANIEQLDERDEQERIDRDDNEKSTVNSEEKSTTSQD